MLPSKHEALSSNPSTAKKKLKKKYIYTYMYIYINSVCISPRYYRTLHVLSTNSTPELYLSPYECF
jgi:hypothetical protein